MRLSTAMRSTIFALAALAAMPSWPEEAATEPSQAQVDAVVRKLESSGALDAAVERAIDRYVKREQEAQRTAREEKESRVAKLVPSLDPKRDHVRGPAGAEVTLVEYTDFECPFCKRFHEIPPRLLERYKGRLNWVIRNLPLPFHEPAAHREAFAAECVAKLGGNDKYWRYTDMLFANTKSNGGGLPPEHSAQKLAADLDIQASAFDACMGDRAIARRVEEDVKSATAAGITGTPTSIVRDNRTGATRVIAGAQTLEEAEQAIESVLGASPGK